MSKIKKEEAKLKKKLSGLVDEKSDSVGTLGEDQELNKDTKTNDAKEVEVEDADEMLEKKRVEKSENSQEVQSEDYKEKFEEAEKEKKEIYSRLLRVSAEFENYKKRSAKEISDFRKFSNESIIKEMLPVIDNLERAIQATQNDNEDVNNGLLEGVQMTLKETLKVFDKFGVSPIDSKGKPFDPNFHQAVMQEESEEFPENTVISELQKGYLLHDRLIRPAMVVVSKEKS